jgi:hypothetical protein
MVILPPKDLKAATEAASDTASINPVHQQQPKIEE